MSVLPQAWDNGTTASSPPPPPPPIIDPPPPPGDEVGVTTVPTYHSIGIYMTPLTGMTSATVVTPKYREHGTSGPWITSFPLTYCVHHTTGAIQWRGSLLGSPTGWGIQPDKSYDIQLFLDADVLSVKSLTDVRTWREDYPIGPTILVPTGVQAGTLVQDGNVQKLAGLVINGVQGTPGAYVLYIPDPASPTNTLDGTNVDFNIHIMLSKYVIVRGFRCANAKERGINCPPSSIDHGCTDVVIEENEIVNWGLDNTAETYCSTGSIPNPDGLLFSLNKSDGIHIDGGQGKGYERFTIQNNTIGPMRNGSNSWSDYRPDGKVNNQCCPLPPLDGSVLRCHPEGSHAIWVSDCHGNFVIRYNDLVGAEPVGAIRERAYNDCIDWSEAKDKNSGRGADTDIYANKFLRTWDDTIQADGQDMMFRVFENYAKDVNNLISFAPCLAGPAYVFCNVLDQTLEHHLAEINNTYAGGHFIKHSHKFGIKKNGKIHVWHNTVWIGPDGNGGVLNALRAGSECLDNIIARNNIWRTIPNDLETHGYAYLSLNCAVGAPLNNSDVDYDLVNHASSTTFPLGANMISGNPTYAAADSFVLANGSLGAGTGQKIAGFDGMYVGGVADIGAAQRGGAPIRYGAGAYSAASGSAVTDLVASPSLEPAAEAFAFSEVDGRTVYQWRIDGGSARLLDPDKVARSSVLLPGSTYDFQVRSKDGTAVGPWSNIQTAMVSNYPVFTGLPRWSSVDGTTARFTMTLSVNCTVYWARRDLGSAVPTAQEIETGAGSLANGSGVFVGTVENHVDVGGLAGTDRFLFAFSAKTAGGVRSFVNSQEASAIASLFIDNFVRANQALTASPDYTLVSGTDQWAVVANKLAKSGVTSGKAMVRATMDLGAIGHYLRVLSATTVNSAQIRWCAAVTDQNKFVSVRRIADAWELEYCSGGNFHSLGTTPAGSGDTWEIQCRDNAGAHEARLLVNGTPMINWIATTLTSPGTKIGFYSNTINTLSPANGALEYGLT